MPSKPRLTEKQQGELLQLYEEGASAPDLEKKFGVSRQTVYAYVRRAGVIPHQLRRLGVQPASDGQVAQWAERVEARWVEAETRWREEVRRAERYRQQLIVNGITPDE